MNTKNWKKEEEKRKGGENSIPWIFLKTKSRAEQNKSESKRMIKKKIERERRQRVWNPSRVCKVRDDDVFFGTNRSTEDESQ